VAGRHEVVIDSSVAVKWFSREDGTEGAIWLRDEHVRRARDLWVSDLLYHEVANALRFKPNYGEKEQRIAIGSLFGLHLNTWPVDESLLQRASMIARDGDVTVYDAVPVALAETKRILCITADEQTQYKKLKGKGYPVELLPRKPMSGRKTH